MTMWRRTMKQHQWEVNGRGYILHNK
jgi:hypothetical protein